MAGSFYHFIVYCDGSVDRGDVIDIQNGQVALAFRCPDRSVFQLDPYAVVNRRCVVVERYAILSGSFELNILDITVSSSPCYKVTSCKVLFEITIVLISTLNAEAEPQV